MKTLLVGSLVGDLVGDLVGARVGGNVVSALVGDVVVGDVVVGALEGTGVTTSRHVPPTCNPRGSICASGTTWHACRDGTAGA